MKLIRNLYYKINEKPITNENGERLNSEELTFSENQYNELGEKHILYVDVQLSGRQLYKTILPYFGMFSENVKTSILNISKYNQKEQLLDLDINLTTKEIFWADFIVFPFTVQNLSVGQLNLYDFIRSINTQCKIVYSVDFNYYELSNLHPYKSIFNEKSIQSVENNIWKSDMCLITNMPLRDYLLDKMKELSKGRMKGVPTAAGIVCMPFYIDSEIVKQNIDYDPQVPKKLSSYSKHNDKVKQKIDKVELPPKTNENKKQIKVIFENEKWVLKKGKYPKPIEIYATKSLAIDETKKWVKKGFDIIIYKKDNTIQKSIINDHQKK